jgi:hypothetical protein
MIKVIRAYDMVTNEHVFSIVAGDKGFNYVFADPKTAMFDSKKRAKMLMEKVGGGLPRLINIRSRPVLFLQPYRGT